MAKFPLILGNTTSISSMNLWLKSFYGMETEEGLWHSLVEMSKFTWLEKHQIQ